MSTIPTYKRYTKKVLSYLGVYPFFDQIKANLLARKISKRNKEFIKEHPDFAIPSVSLAYDAYAHVDWRSYYENGIKDANWIGSLILKYCSSRPLTILDWGCGPARILRHIPSALHSQPVQLYGTDYNQKTIDWCQEQFPHIHFISNQLLPPLNLKDNFFDAIYGISVFTHLSKESHYKWIKELHRIVKPGGILILTTHGNRFKQQLSEKEQKQYENHQLVVRADTTEGKRAFATFHPPKFLKENLFHNFEILEHISDAQTHPIQFPQDIWVIRKKKES